MNAFSKLVAFAAFGALSLSSGAAAAKPNFPGQITLHLNLTYSPPCSICHIDGVTGGETVVTPFGRAMVANGLSGKTGIDIALTNLTQLGTDSDGDGVSDVQELIQGTDPNSPANGSLSGPTPSAGCAMTGLRSDGGALFAAATVAISLLFARRRDRR